MVARRVGPGRSAAVGLAIFAGAGLACGVSDHLSTLIIARSVQALGGALAVTASLELLPLAVGSERRAVHARVAEGEERERLWVEVVDLYGGYRDYQERTERQIPLVVLEPRGGSR